MTHKTHQINEGLLLNSARFIKQKKYWKKKLSHDMETTELLVDPGKARKYQETKEKKAVIIPHQLGDQLLKLCKYSELSLYIVLLAAIKNLLYHYTGNQDISVISPINRLQASLETINDFLLVRDWLAQEMTFKELLLAVRQSVVEAYENQDYPFEILLKDIVKTTRTGNNERMPRFCHIVCLLRNIHHDWNKQPLEGKLVFSFALEYRQIKGDIFYNSRVYEANYIKQISQHFTRLLANSLADVNINISNNTCLSKEEKRKILYDFNNTRANHPPVLTVHGLFEEQVRKTPDHTALVGKLQNTNDNGGGTLQADLNACGEVYLSYGELNEISNRMAQLLRGNGVEPDSIVAMILERSIEMLMGIIGILKAGGAYLPIEPGIPRERLKYLLADSGSKILVSARSLSEEGEKLSRWEGEKIFLEPDYCPVRGQVSSPLLHQDVVSTTAFAPTASTLASTCQVSRANLAYIIYTSGSTGRPKGVMIEHQQLLNYIFGITPRVKPVQGMHYAAVSTPAADLGNTVIYISLSSGGCLHLLPDQLVTDSHGMMDYIERHAIDCLKIVPSHFAALQTVSHPEKLMPRRLLILGGEASQTDWVISLKKRVPYCRIMNHYGPSEATIGVSTFMADQAEILHTTTLPIGRPLNNTRLYILNQGNQPVVIGVPGELIITGDSPGRGYLNRVQLSHHKFVTNPFEPGTRMYRTGDLAKWLPDGNIQFLGRLDDQLKVRGYRIEPNEIKTTIEKHPGIKHAVVLPVESAHQPGRQRLTAYIVPREQYKPVINGRKRYQLPNNLAVLHLNQNETNYIYQEIFERQAYLQHEITLNDGDCVVDVGANIGLFTLYASLLCKNLKIYAFEPNPTVYEILTANVSLYCRDQEAKLFNCGLSNEKKVSPFTFVKGFSLLSGLYLDIEKEKKLLKTYLMNQYKNRQEEVKELVNHADGILDERFHTRTFQVPLQSLSEIIKQEGISCIDLLKINVEKAELEVLMGINTGDWSKIRQIVLEVDVKENLEIIISMLENNGFRWEVEQDALLEGTPLYYIYAVKAPGKVRKEKEKSAVPALKPLQAHCLITESNMKDFLKEKLPEYMIPSHIIVLETLPLTPNGKVDRQALQETEKKLDVQYVAPGTDHEKRIAEAWKSVLKVEKVGIHDNFFDIGGTSLDIIKVINQLKETLSPGLSSLIMFKYPTIHTLARYLAGEKNRKNPGDAISTRKSNREREREDAREQGKNRLKQQMRQRKRE